MTWCIFFRFQRRGKFGFVPAWLDIPSLLSLSFCSDDHDHDYDDDYDDDDDFDEDHADDDESETRMARGRCIRSDQVNKTQHKVSRLHTPVVDHYLWYC